MGQSKDKFTDEMSQPEIAPAELSVNNIPGITRLGVSEFHKRVKAAIFETGYGVFRYLELIKFIGKVNEEIFGSQSKEPDTEFISYVRDQISRNGSAGYTSPNGVKFELAETGASYDYSNSSAWNELNVRIEELKKEKGRLEVFLKGIPAGKEFVDPDTGEVFYGPAKSSKSSIKVTIGKQ